jgi:hypothetical protein
MHEADSEQASQPAAGETGKPIVSRRGLLRGIGLGTPIITVAYSRPVLGGNICGWSGWMSGNASGPQDDSHCHKGKRPDHWCDKNKSYTHWSACGCKPKVRDAHQNHCNLSGYGWYSSYNPVGWDGKKFKDCFGIAPRGGDDNTTLLEVLLCSEYQNKVERWASACYLNAHYGFYDPSDTSMDDVKNCYLGFRAGNWNGYYIDEYACEQYYRHTCE